ncbi:hypothetical protein FPOAC1_004004 [Fusarium poae]|uniref:hypothetical protein n=1 Tax=Fusarium poae TaxID=36050 RepID=UPI001CE75DF0|nr:hypothetical protein FPOAC1_004004 [Fusarium poae]KAG8670770.1 hypothetical protein FPOAC1_004004 [Fusarium poae]
MMAPPALPLHRHQSSLEGIIDFSSRQPLSESHRASAIRRFYHVINHFDSEDVKRGQDQYDRVKLVRFTYEYSTNQESKDNVLIAVFEFLNLSVSSEEDIDFEDVTYREQLKAHLYKFADYLVDNFFLPPVKASTKKTPQPTPASHSAVMKTQRQNHIFSGTPERLANLRAEALKRSRRPGGWNEALDQDSAPLLGQKFARLEVAHIIPHSLTQLNSSRELNPSKIAALAILNMFDSGVAFLIEGVGIDRPGNALTLSHDLHMSFGDFQLSFILSVHSDIMHELISRLTLLLETSQHAACQSCGTGLLNATHHHAQVARLHDDGNTLRPEDFHDGMSDLLGQALLDL